MGVLASRDPCVVGSMVRLLSAMTSCLQSVSMLLSTHAIGLTWRAMSPTKAESSRAIATQILLSASLRVERGQRLRKSAQYWRSGNAPYGASG
jgi:hypothetical protein